MAAKLPHKTNPAAHCFRISVAGGCSPEETKEASLAELIKAFSLLKKAELGIKAKQAKISGLLAYRDYVSLKMGWPGA